MPDRISPTNRARASSFGRLADVYDRARAEYPAAAVADLLGDDPLDVIDIGAGTGKLTRGLAAAGHRVVAVDSSEHMLDVLSNRSPRVEVHRAPAESVPLPTASADAIVVGQARHWFDTERSDPEMYRLLRDGGIVGLFWNIRDRHESWVEVYDDLVGATDSGESFEPRPLRASFSPLTLRSYRHNWSLELDGFVDLAASRSTVAVMNATERHDTLEKVRSLGREIAVDGIVTMPHRLDVWSATRLTAQT